MQNMNKPTRIIMGKKFKAKPYLKQKTGFVWDRLIRHKKTNVRFYWRSLSPDYLRIERPGAGIWIHKDEVKWILSVLKDKDLFNPKPGKFTKSKKRLAPSFIE